jgi:hypothetical protein
VEKLDSSAPAPATRYPRTNSKIITVWAPTALVLVVITMVLLLRPAVSLPPPVVLLQNGFPKYKPTLFERCVPVKPGWGWAWKIREFVMGRARTIDLAVVVLEYPELSEKALPGLPLEKASYADTNGFQVWLLGNPDLSGATERIRQLPNSRMVSRPRVSTSSGVECNMQADQTLLGLLAYAHADRTDLYTRFTQVDAPVSNMTSAKSYDESSLGKGLRLQVPHGSGVLLLKTDLKTGKRIEVALTLAFPQQKK